MAHNIVDAVHKALTSIHLSKPSLITPTPSVPATKKRACVAIIIRVRPGDKATSDGSQHESSSCSPSNQVTAQSGILSKIQTFFSSPWVRLGSLEMFFIQRASRPGDRWSGYVAYPGGRQEATDESLLHTVHREVKEEVGIDLTGPNFIQVGQLDDREITTSLGKRMLMVLSPFVFLYTSPDPLIPRLQASEITSAHWVPLSCVLGPDARWSQVSFDIGSRITHSYKIVHSVLSVLLGKMYYQSILLPDDPLKSPTLHMQEEAVGLVKKPEQQPTLPLWGPCLAICLELLSHAGLPEYTENTSTKKWRTKLESAVPQRTSEQDLALPSMSTIFPTSSPDIDFFVWLFGRRYRDHYKRWMNSRYSLATENGLHALDGSESDKEEGCPCSMKVSADDAEREHLRALTLHHFYAAVRKALILAVVIRTVLFIGVLCAMPFTYNKRK